MCTRAPVPYASGSLPPSHDLTCCPVHNAFVRIDRDALLCGVTVYVCCFFIRGDFLFLSALFSNAYLRQYHTTETASTNQLPAFAMREDMAVTSGSLTETVSVFV